MSRAYYAAFCYARNFARDTEGFVPIYKSEDHRALREHFAITRSQVSLQLEQLRQWRNDCDYKDNVAIETLNILLPESIGYAQEIIEELI